MASNDVLEIVDSGDEAVVEPTPVVTSTSVTAEKQGRRKNPHQPRHVSPVLFQTISLEDTDDIDKENSFSASMASAFPTESANVQQSTNESKPTESLTLPDDIKELITQISKERVRINFILEARGMDKFEFPVCAEPELIETELRKRLAEYREPRKD